MQTIRLLEETQTEEICIEEVSRDGLLLVFVETQTFEICKAAVEQNCEAIKYVDFDMMTSTLNKDQELDIFDIAFKQNGMLLENYSAELRMLGAAAERCYITAFEQNPDSWKYIDNPSYKMIYEILKKEPRILTSLSAKDRNIFTRFVEEN